MKRTVAEEISKMTFECCAKLEDSVGLVNEECDAEEAKRYRRAVAEAVATMVADILRPIWVEYPDLKPDLENGGH